MKNQSFTSLAIIVAVWLAGCTTSPTGRKQMMFIPESQVDAMGVQAFDDLKAKQPVDSNGARNSYIRCVANAITAVLPEKRQWEVVVFQNKEANAFALPGGKIGVNTGLLKVAQTPPQLAAVIGHEIGHVLAKHGNERLSDQFIAQGGMSVLSAVFANRQDPKYSLITAALGVGLQYGVVLPYGRAQETEADIIGLDLMSKAGFDPLQSVDLWRNMEKMGNAQPPEFLSDHPSHENRIQTLQSHMADAEATYARAAVHPVCTPSP